MSSIPAISIIIPVYNVEKYLEECLDSLLSQSLNNIEILCINDGSTDRSLDILQQYAKKDIRLKILNQQNSGSGIARNKGMEQAKGDYLVFLDSDDFFDPTFIEEMYSRALQTESDVVICNFFEFDNTKKIANAKTVDPLFLALSEKSFFSPEQISENIFNIFSFSPWNKIYRRRFIQKQQICYQSLSSCNDLFFTCSALAVAERISVVNKNLVYWRTNRPDSITTLRKTSLSITNAYKAWKKVKSFLEENFLYEKFRKSFVNASSESFLYELNCLTLTNQIKTLYLLKSEWFKNLDLTGHPEEYYYFNGHYKAIQKIINDTFHVPDPFKLMKYHFLSIITFGKKQKYYNDKYLYQKTISDYFAKNK